MRFHADLHVHSKYSRATSRDADVEHLAYWAARKGISVVATGDFTHPAWMAELKAKLAPAEPGLFRLRDDLARELGRTLPTPGLGETRFMLSVEISTIYKKGERTRKIHHLLYAPSFDAADRIASSLARIGNITSDGRPILGLDSRHLLEITLASDPGSYLIPAHIWTPWFAALGSKSGFDSITECYGDLADHIFAVETGLSSDPPMNWRLSMLDRYRLVSNSDAHSPPRLGRETTLFDGERDYFAIRRALETGEGYVGTVEFFPEEGKYHLDGHRKCGVRHEPHETIAHGGRCPVCGQPTTVGVLHRVETLADRAESDQTRPATAGDVSNLVPLAEVLAEIAGTSPSSKAVERGYDRLVGTLGPELSILGDVPLEDVARADSALLAEAIGRLREGRVIRDAGYDGEYGVIRLFEPGELQRRTSGGMLFDVPLAASAPRTRGRAVRERATASPENPPTANEARAAGAIASANTGHDDSVLARLDADQRKAASTVGAPLIIIAGPGSGKTRTLTHRIAYLVAERGVPAAACLAITFTRRAAAEMRERLTTLLSAAGSDVAIHTFHSLALGMLREHPDAAGLHRGFHVASEAERIALLAAAAGITERAAGALLPGISTAKRTGRAPSADVERVLPVYQQALAVRNGVDFDDLVRLAVDALAADPALVAAYRARFRSISVDEFQDVDELQYRLLTLLAPPGGDLCVIGDPNQAIYGFRGADAACFERFTRDYPRAVTVTLARNYRSSGTIVAAASQVIASGKASSDPAGAARAMLDRITIHTAPTERAEAEHVVHRIERMIGGHSFFSIDSGRTEGPARDDLSFADFAVLYRTNAQAAALREAFARSGMPFTTHGHDPLAERADVQAILRALHAATDDDVQLPLPAALRAAAERAADGDPAPDRAAVHDALQQLLALAESCAHDRARFVDAVALATDVDTWDPRADRVSLLTLHAAKGLEFPVVFIVGLEDGILPLRWGDDALDAAALAEERRLCYVGMTRAKDRLIVSRAAQRAWRGRVRALDPSPFLRDIESELVTNDERPLTRRPPDDTQLMLL
jgi:DNA helicase-2/ATP-dependent DNA helicase PcrA